MKTAISFFLFFSLLTQVYSWPWGNQAQIVKKEYIDEIVKKEEDKNKARCAGYAFERVGLECDSMSEDDFKKLCSLITICYLKEIMRTDIQCDSDMSGEECSRIIIERDDRFLGVYTQFYDNYKMNCYMGNEDYSIRKANFIMAKTNKGYEAVMKAMLDIDGKVKESGDDLLELKKLYETSSTEVKTKMTEGFNDVKAKGEEMSKGIRNLQGTVDQLYSGLKNFSKDANDSFNQINGGIEKVKQQNEELKTVAEESLKIGKEANVELSKMGTGIKNLADGFNETINKIDDLNSQTILIVSDMKNEVINKKDEFKKEIDNLMNPFKTLMESIDNYIFTWGNALYYFAWFIAIVFFGSFTGSSSIRTILISTLLMFFVLDRIRMFKFLKEIYTIFATLLLIFGSLFNMTRQFTQSTKTKYPQPMYYPQMYHTGKIPPRVHFKYGDLEL